MRLAMLCFKSGTLLRLPVGFPLALQAGELLNLKNVPLAVEVLYEPHGPIRMLGGNAFRNAWTWVPPLFVQMRRCYFLVFQAWKL